jgi:hypothetical protein
MPAELQPLKAVPRCIQKVETSMAALQIDWRHQEHVPDQRRVHARGRKERVTCS